MQTIFDPQISEWDNPIYWRYIILKRKLTQGTETSKYLEEKKTKVISLVAASETELAQTDRIYPVGVVGLTSFILIWSWIIWKVNPKKVKDL